MAKEEVAVAVIEAKEGLAERVISVEVPIKTCWPPEMERLEEETVRLPRVLVAVPPLLTPKTPETSEEPRAMAPLNRAPEAVVLTGRALERLAMVVEPKALTENRVLPVEEEIIRGELFPACPTTTNLALGVVVEMPMLVAVS